MDTEGRAGFTDIRRSTLAPLTLRRRALRTGAELNTPERARSDGTVIISARESAQETVNELGQEGS